MLTSSNFTSTHSEFLPVLITRQLAIRAVAYKHSKYQPNWHWQACYLTLIYNRLTVDQLAWCQQQFLSEQLESEDKNGRIWQDKQTGQFYRGKQPLSRFSPLEENILVHLIKHADQRQTYSEIIAAGWPEGAHEYVSDDCIYQVMYRLRQKVELFPAQPQYILNWRGQPEGGYLLQQNGRLPHA